jgi:hypothetical protein
MDCDVLLLCLLFPALARVCPVLSVSLLFLFIWGFNGVTANVLRGIAWIACIGTMGIQDIPGVFGIGIGRNVIIRMDGGISWVWDGLRLGVVA